MLLQPYHQQYLARGGRFGQGQDASKGCTGEQAAWYYPVSVLDVSFGSPAGVVELVVQLALSPAPTGCSSALAQEHQHSSTVA